MIRLRAYHPYDASAVLEDKGHLFFAERPYVGNLRLITPAQLDYLLRRMEYVAVDQEFASMEAAENEVHRIATELRHRYPASPLTEEELIAGYELYSEAMLQFLIEDVRDRFVAAGKFQEAERLVSDLWKVKKIAAHRQLRTLLADVENIVQGAIAPMEELKAQPITIPFTYLPTETPALLIRFRSLQEGEIDKAA